MIPALNANGRMIRGWSRVRGIRFARLARATPACKAASGNLYCWGSNHSNWARAGFTTAPFCHRLSGRATAHAGANSRAHGPAGTPVLDGNVRICAHLANGTTPCWGFQLPQFPAGRSLDRLSRGFEHYCTIASGTLQCAGSGVLGDGHVAASLPGVGPVRSVQRRPSVRSTPAEVGLAPSATTRTSTAGVETPLAVSVSESVVS